jgi:DUF971 family protein
LTSRDDRVEPGAIDVDRTEAVTVEFLDGVVARFALLELRLGCPCATCRSLRDRGEVTWPRPGSPEPLAIRDAGLHGGWGLAVTWNDGHATGIYPFEALRRWHDGDTPYPPDSGLGGPTG